MKTRLIVVLAVLATVVGMAFAADIKPLKTTNEDTVYLSKKGQYGESGQYEYTVTVTGYNPYDVPKTASFKILESSTTAAKEEAIKAFKMYKTGLRIW